MVCFSLLRCVMRETYCRRALSLLHSLNEFPHARTALHARHTPLAVPSPAPTPAPLPLATPAAHAGARGGAAPRVPWTLAWPLLRWLLRADARHLASPAPRPTLAAPTPPSARAVTRELAAAAFLYPFRWPLLRWPPWCCLMMLLLDAALLTVDHDPVIEYQLQRLESFTE